MGELVLLALEEGKVQAFDEDGVFGVAALREAKCVVVLVAVWGGHGLGW